MTDSFLCVSLLHHFNDVFSHKNCLLFRYECHFRENYFGYALWERYCIYSARNANPLPLLFFSVPFANDFPFKQTNTAYSVALLDVKACISLIVFLLELITRFSTHQRAFFFVLLTKIIADSFLLKIHLNFRLVAIAPFSRSFSLLLENIGNRLRRDQRGFIFGQWLYWRWKWIVSDPQWFFQLFALNLVEHIHAKIIIEFSSQMSTKSPLRSVSSMPKQPPAFDPTIYVTKNLPVDDIVRLKECFDIFDYDKSGNVSTEELATAIRALGLEKEAGKILHIVHAQSSEIEMDFQTFLQIFGFNGDSQSESSLQQLFQVFDKNSLGSFGVEEFAQICESVGERFSQAEIEQMIEYADKDRDGRINFKEFFDVVTKEYPQI